MIRLEDWPGRLAGLVKAAMNMPIGYRGSDAMGLPGGHNCPTFAAGAMIALTDIDPLAEFRGAWKNRAEAFALLNRLHGSVTAWIEAVAVVHDMHEVPWAMARRGDWVSLETQLGITVGVMIDHRAAFAGDKGLEFIPANLVSRAWVI